MYIDILYKYQIYKYLDIGLITDCFFFWKYHQFKSAYIILGNSMVIFGSAHYSFGF